MPELNVIPKKGVSISDFLNFKADLEFLLKCFPAQKLADWLKMDKGNLSKKINGKEQVTDRFIQSFNEVMEYPVLLLHQGKSPQEVEDEMERRLREGAPNPEKVRVSVFDQAIVKVVEGMLDIQAKVLEVEEKSEKEIRGMRAMVLAVEDRNEKNEREIGGIKVVLREYDIALKELKEVVFRPGRPQKAS